jgi:hypothetical protein
MRNALVPIGLLIATGCRAHAGHLTDDKAARKRLEFHLLSLCDAIDADATKAGFRTALFSNVHLGCSKFRAPDGEVLVEYDTEFRSADEAIRYLDWEVARSVKVIRRGVKLDRKGNSVGRRAEVELTSDQSYSVLMWTHGAFFHLIQAKSRADAEELERRERWCVIC